MAERVNLPKEKVDSVVAKGWEILVGTDLEPVPLESSPFDSGSFQILGLCFMRCKLDKILVICRGREPLARDVGASLFDSEEQDLALPELQDAFAELTNIFSGNLRGILPENYDSDLPMVISGRDLSISIGDTTTIHRAFFRSSSGIIEINIRANF